MESSVARKANLSQHQLSMLESEMNKRAKSPGVAWFLFIILTPVAAHRFYLRKGIIGNIFYILTMGYFLIGIFYDLVTLNSQIQNVNEAIESEIIDEILAHPARIEAAATEQ